MPKLLEVKQINLEWTDILSRVRHPSPVMARTPGIHLSNVLRYVAIQSGILTGVDSTTGKWKGDQHKTEGGMLVDIDEDEMPLRMVLGMAFEEWVAGLYPEMIWQPGEHHKDRVFGTPDGVSPSPNGLGLVVEEFKLTWKSEWAYGKDRFLTANWMWIHQGMGYVSMLQSEGYEVSRRVRYHICWANGDYRPPAPKYLTYLVEFSQLELDRGWKIITSNRDKPGVKREG